MKKTCLHLNQDKYKKRYYVMDFADYLELSEKKYHLRLKTVIPLNDLEMSRIERVVSKYDPLYVSSPSKTMIQKNPLDFDREVENAEVWIVDFIFGLPADPMVIREDIRKTLNAPERFVIVKTRNDPTEIETLRLNAIEEIEQEAKKRKLKPASLLNDEPEYIEGNGNIDDGKNLFGNDYNNSLLYYLQQVRDKRVDPVYQTKNTLFDYLDLPKRNEQEPYQTDDNYNEKISPIKVHPKKSDVKIDIPIKSIMGGIDDQNRTISKVFKDENGKRIVISRKFGDQK